MGKCGFGGVRKWGWYGVVVGQGVVMLGLERVGKYEKRWLINVRKGDSVIWEKVDHNLI